MGNPDNWERSPAERHTTERDAEKAAAKLAQETGEEYDVLRPGWIGNP
jgi:hypothetical protein